MHAGISLADVDVEDQIDGDVGKSVTPLDSKHDDESGKNLGERENVVKFQAQKNLFNTKVFENFAGGKRQ